MSVRSSPPKLFLGKGVLQTCSKFTEEQPCRRMIAIKLLCNFIEITLQYECSPVNTQHISKTPFPKNTFWSFLQIPVLTEKNKRLLNDMLGSKGKSFGIDSPYI